MIKIQQTTTIARAITLCAIGALLTGCAPFEAYPYYPSFSKAYNIANSAGIRAGMKDRVAPKGYNNLGAGAFASADLYATYFMNPSLGLTDWGSLGLGLFSKIFGPKEAGRRSSLFAWMPTEHPDITPEQVQKQFDAIVNDAVVSALQELEIDYSYAGLGRFGQHVFKLNNAMLDCSELTECALEYRIKRPL